MIVSKNIGPTCIDFIFFCSETLEHKNLIKRQEISYNSREKMEQVRYNLNLISSEAHNSFTTFSKSPSVINFGVGINKCLSQVLTLSLNQKFRSELEHQSAI